MAGLADGGDPHRLGALLPHRHQRDDATVGQRETVTAALVDREVGADVGPRLEQPAHADVVGAVLLVGDHQQPAGRRPGGSPSGRARPRRRSAPPPRSSCRRRRARRASRPRRRPRTAGGSSRAGRPARRRGARRTPARDRCRSPATARPGWPARGRGRRARPRGRRRAGSRAGTPRPRSRCRWSCRSGSGRARPGAPRRPAGSTCPPPLVCGARTRPSNQLRRPRGSPAVTFASGRSRGDQWSAGGQRAESLLRPSTTIGPPVCFSP